VFEELDTKTRAEMRAFDEAGEIGDRVGLGVGIFADLYDTEIGFEGGEGVVGDLGFGGGEAGDECGLADVRVAYKAGVGQETKFQAIGAFFTGAAEFVFARSLMGAGGKVLVAATAATAPGDDDSLIGMGEVVDQLAGLVVVEQGSDRDFQGSVLACLTGTVGAETVASALGFVLRVEAKVD
jgi:hypothetical protein